MRYSQRASLFLWSRAPHGPWPLSAVDDAPRRDFVSAAALKYGRDDACARVVLRTHKYTVKLTFKGHVDGVKRRFHVHAQAPAAPLRVDAGAIVTVLELVGGAHGGETPRVRIHRRQPLVCCLTLAAFGAR